MGLLGGGCDVSGARQKAALASVGGGEACSAGTTHGVARESPNGGRGAGFAFGWGPLAAAAAPLAAGSAPSHPNTTLFNIKRLVSRYAEVTAESIIVQRIPTARPVVVRQLNVKDFMALRIQICHRERAALL